MFSPAGSTCHMQCSRTSITCQSEEEAQKRKQQRSHLVLQPASAPLQLSSPAIKPVFSASLAVIFRTITKILELSCNLLDVCFSLLLLYKPAGLTCEPDHRNVRLHKSPFVFFFFNHSISSYPLPEMWNPDVLSIAPSIVLSNLKVVHAFTYFYSVVFVSALHPPSSCYWH